MAERNYRREYDTYHASKTQKKRRAMRNTARRQAVKKYGKAALEGKDVDHIRPLSKGGTNAPSNRRILPRSKNRSRK